MSEVIAAIENAAKKASLPQVRSGDSVRVHQKIREGKKERVQVFEGTVIRRRRYNSLSATITVRRLSGGIGVEKTYFMHSPNVVKVDIIKRGRVRRNYLTYLRERQGKSTRLQDVAFDKQAANQQTTIEESKPKEKEEGKAEKPAKAEKLAAAKAEGKPDTLSPKAPAVAKAMADKSDAQGKVAEKKAKAEAFRKAQAAKK